MLAPQEVQGTQIYTSPTGTLPVSPGVKPSLPWRAIDMLEVVTARRQAPTHPHPALTLRGQDEDPGILTLPPPAKSPRFHKETSLRTSQQPLSLRLQRTGTTDPIRQSRASSCPPPPTTSPSSRICAKEAMPMLHPVPPTSRPPEKPRQGWRCPAVGDKQLETDSGRESLWEESDGSCHVSPSCNHRS